MPASDWTVAIDAVEAGAAVVRDRFGSTLARIDKPAGDFATDADVNAERAILSVLRTARPDDAVHGEELGEAGPGTAGRRWLVDPLCGTVNYAARTRLAAVNVALTQEGRTLAAAVADPFADEVFWTDGARSLRRRRGVDEPLLPSAGSHLVDVNLDPPFPNATRFSAAALLANDAFTKRFRPRVLSTTLALAWVGAGRRAAYVTDGRVVGSVHFTAAIALCSAAGCVITDLFGRPLGDGPSGLIAAADEATHRALRGIVEGQLCCRES